MARPSSNAKEKVLNSAMGLMLEKGYVATSVDEICEQSGVTKGNFFHHFKNKEDMGIQLTDYYMKILQEKMLKFSVLDPFDDPLDNINRFLDYVTDMSRDEKFKKSCLLGNLAQELSFTHPKLKEHFLNHIKQIEAILVQFIEAANKKYSKSINAQTLTEMMLSLFQGLLLISKAKDDSELTKRNIEFFRDFLIKFYKTE